jgi:lipid II:glycine glycyltransferase (peptidoglycan interpeptide bridge formation enzyme)
VEEESHPVGEMTVDRLKECGFSISSEQVQFKHSMTLALSPSEDDLLSAMKQKTRYNVRLAARRGVQVREGSARDLELLYQMYAETSLRDGFAIREPAYYHAVWGGFTEGGLAQPFIAEVDEVPIAAIIVYRFGDTASYLYGMSRDLHRNLMPTYLLQWEGIRWAKRVGCRTYDFWGAPDTFDDTDPMWGVFRFKAGFGARIVRLIGAWDYAARPTLFWLYSSLMPRILALMRFRGRLQTEDSLR